VAVSFDPWHYAPEGMNTRRPLVRSRSGLSRIFGGCPTGLGPQCQKDQESRHSWAPGSRVLRPQTDLTGGRLGSQAAVVGDRQVAAPSALGTMRSDDHQRTTPLRTDEGHCPIPRGCPIGLEPSARRPREPPLQGPRLPRAATANRPHGGSTGVASRGESRLTKWQRLSALGTMPLI
jgi:hypothetical protein